MPESPITITDFDLYQALVDRSSGDSAAFMDQLAEVLVLTLPMETNIERREEKFFNRQRAIKQIDLPVATFSYSIQVQKNGSLLAFRTGAEDEGFQKTENLTLSDWLKVVCKAAVERIAGNVKLRTALQAVLEQY